jgi:hypothetical protein
VALLSGRSDSAPILDIKAADFLPPANKTIFFDCKKDDSRLGFNIFCDSNTCVDYYFNPAGNPMLYDFKTNSWSNAQSDHNYTLYYNKSLPIPTFVLDAGNLCGGNFTPNPLPPFDANPARRLTGNVSPLSDATLKDCDTSCQNNILCVGYNYRLSSVNADQVEPEWPGKCILFISDGQADVYEPAKTPGASSWTYFVKKPVVYPAGRLEYASQPKLHTNVSHQLCEIRCENDDTCVGFNYHVEESSCTFFSNNFNLQLGEKRDDNSTVVYFPKRSALSQFSLVAVNMSAFSYYSEERDCDAAEGSLNCLAHNCDSFTVIGTSCYYFNSAITDLRKLVKVPSGAKYFVRNGAGLNVDWRGWETPAITSNDQDDFPPNSYNEPFNASFLTLSRTFGIPTNLESIFVDAIGDCHFTMEVYNQDGAVLMQSVDRSISFSHIPRVKSFFIVSNALEHPHEDAAVRHARVRLEGPLDVILEEKAAECSPAPLSRIETLVASTKVWSGDQQVPQVG